MQVRYVAGGSGGEGTSTSETCTVLSLVGVDEAGGMSHWTLADVRANHQAAGARTVVTAMRLTVQTCRVRVCMRRSPSHALRACAKMYHERTNKPCVR